METTKLRWGDTCEVSDTRGVGEAGKVGGSCAVGTMSAVRAMCPVGTKHLKLVIPLLLALALLPIGAFAEEGKVKNSSEERPKVIETVVAGEGTKSLTAEELDNKAVIIPEAIGSDAGCLEPCVETDYKAQKEKALKEGGAYAVPQKRIDRSPPLDRMRQLTGAVTKRPFSKEETSRIEVMRNDKKLRGGPLGIPLKFNDTDSLGWSLLKTLEDGSKIWTRSTPVFEGAINIGIDIKNVDIPKGANIGFYGVRPDGTVYESRTLNAYWHFIKPGKTTGGAYFMRTDRAMITYLQPQGTPNPTKKVIFVIDTIYYGFSRSGPSSRASPLFLESKYNYNFARFRSESNF